MARVEVHQAHAGIFHLRAADAVGGVVNVVRQTFIAARLEVRWVFGYWFVQLYFWLVLYRFWRILVYRIAVLADRIRFLVNIRLFLVGEAWRRCGQNICRRYGNCLRIAASALSPVGTASITSTFSG
jgi:hypothetical protein